jgi:hypothetical protein
VGRVTLNRGTLGHALRRQTYSGLTANATLASISESIHSQSLLRSRTQVKRIPYLLKKSFATNLSFKVLYNAVHVYVIE